MSKRIDEQKKLYANLLNGAAGACITTGIISPVVAVFFNFGKTAGDVPLWKLGISVGGFGFAAIVLRIAGRQVLGSLSE